MILLDRGSSYGWRMETVNGWLVCEILNTEEEVIQQGLITHLPTDSPADIPHPRNLPMAKQPWATARKFAPAAADVFRLVSVTWFTNYPATVT